MGKENLGYINQTFQKITGFSIKRVLLKSKKPTDDIKLSYNFTLMQPTEKPGSECMLIFMYVGFKAENIDARRR